MSARITRKRRRAADTPSPVSKRTRVPEKECTDAEMLCARCCGIHTKVADSDIRTEPPSLIANVDDDHEELLRSVCAFCRLLGSIKDPKLEGGANGLYAFSANAIYARVRTVTLKRNNIRSSVLVGFGVASATRSTTPKARDFIGLVDRKDEGQRITIGPRRISKNSIDYSMIKDWILFCQGRHKHLCSPSSSDVVKNMKVFDVDKRKIVAKPDECEYVALSYVWGTQAAASDKYSNVVEDSFVVTKNLGYKYLWVDRHCIDQDDDTNKHDQIQAMHLIYGNAVLTLVAAAGKGSDYGLPGVGRRERVQQNTLFIDDKLYIRAFPHANITLRTSQWARRGWTYQEGMLSKRRLIFTDYQVAFQCNGMHCSEAVHWPYELMHAKSSSRFPQNVPNAPFPGLTFDQDYFNEHRPYQNLVRNLLEYSQRTLSFPSDTLNAFLGILSSFASRKNPIYHVWGVPVVLDQDHENWSLKLNWMHPRPCKRRPEFPSWSWAGWSGPVLPGVHVHMGGRNIFATGLEKDSRGDEAEIVDLKDFAKEHDKFSAYATSSPFIQVTIWTIDLEFTRVSWSGPSESAIQAYYKKKYPNANPRSDHLREGLYAKLPRRGYTELAYFHIDDMEFDTSSLEGKTLPAMLYEENPMTTDTTFIILVHRAEDRYERLGTVIFSPGSVEPIPDVAFRLDNGRLSKVRPDIPVRAGEPELLPWEDRRKQLDIRLG